MDIFGLSITYTPKRKREELELEVFEKCVNGINETVNIAKQIISKEPDIRIIQKLSETQERLETLIEIYLGNKFSRPTNAFNLTTIINDMRRLYVKYTAMAAERSTIINELLNIPDEEDMDEEDEQVRVDRRFEKDAGQILHLIDMNIKLVAKEYFVSLNAIKFTITYDATRIALGTDIIKEYHKSKKYKIPKRGMEFVLRFKRLSKAEINAQLKSEEEKKNEHVRNGV